MYLLLTKILKKWTKDLSQPDNRTNVMVEKNDERQIEKGKNDYGKKYKFLKVKPKRNKSNLMIQLMKDYSHLNLVFQR